jgi:multidrug resistance efflux pump
MSNRAPIPIPLRQRWKEFRLRVLPLIVFVSALAGVAVLWKNYVTGTSLTGQVEARQFPVIAARAGLISQLTLHRFQNVRAGEPFGQVASADTRLLAASLAVIQQKLANIRAAEPKPNQATESPAPSDEALILNSLRTRASLAWGTLKSRHEPVERHHKLSGDDTGKKHGSRKDSEPRGEGPESRPSEVDSKQLLLNGNEPAASSAEQTNATVQTPGSPLRPEIALIEAELSQVEAELTPFTLIAPVDGTVDHIYHHSGETVPAGEPIVSFTPLNPDSITAYLRAPLTLEPKAGMSVLVRTRSPGHSSGLGKIIGIGTSFEPVTGPFLPGSRASNSELGLPISISLPEGLHLRGGEMVDLTMIAP